ncbi:hypothetical protein [Rhodoplanes azumiensis]|uniref:Thioredoxin domain-containing protein n=1 Tax=Rhodoplanes azumiensis TaxID=1897628 RepID=A0ABW5AIH8_9BRAD
MPTRRTALALIVAAAAVHVRPVLAAQPVVEILAMGHWPVRKALEPVREVLARYAGRIRVVEMDIEAPDGEKRLKAVGLKGHIPIVVLIDGGKAFKRPDGRTVEFVNFPAAAGNPMGMNGQWSAADLEAALRAALGETAD